MCISTSDRSGKGGARAVPRAAAAGFAGTPPRVRASRPLGSGSWAAGLNKGPAVPGVQFYAGRLEWSDTPPRPNASRECPLRRKACLGPGRARLHNSLASLHCFRRGEYFARVSMIMAPLRQSILRLALCHSFVRCASVCGTASLLHYIPYLGRVFFLRRRKWVKGLTTGAKKKNKNKTGFKNFVRCLAAPGFVLATAIKRVGLSRPVLVCSSAC